VRRTSEDVCQAPALELESELGAGWSADGAIDVLEPLVSEARRARIREVLDGRLASVTLLMDAPHDPHNGAAVLRSCDAFGVQELHVVPRAEPFLLSSRVAKGSERWIDVVEHPDPESAVKLLRARGFTLVATHPRGELTPGELGGIPRLALVLGNEHDGIRDALAAAAERSVRIPMRGFVESLNVSVSAAVLLEAATRSRPGDLPPEQYRALYARGLFRSVVRGRDVLDALSPR
jgi:tRNA (guanosine-2'-O-)-methyltransferase